MENNWLLLVIYGLLVLVEVGEKRETKGGKGQNRGRKEGQKGRMKRVEDI